MSKERKFAKAITGFAILGSLAGCVTPKNNEPTPVKPEPANTPTTLVLPDSTPTPKILEIIYPTATSTLKPTDYVKFF